LNGAVVLAADEQVTLLVEPTTTVAVPLQVVVFQKEQLKVDEVFSKLKDYNYSHYYMHL
jgi:hypothetical protein